MSDFGGYIRVDPIRAPILAEITSVGVGVYPKLMWRRENASVSDYGSCACRRMPPATQAAIADATEGSTQGRGRVSDRCRNVRGLGWDGLVRPIVKPKGGSQVTLQRAELAYGSHVMALRTSSIRDGVLR